MSSSKREPRTSILLQDNSALEGLGVAAHQPSFQQQTGGGQIKTLSDDNSLEQNGGIDEKDKEMLCISAPGASPDEKKNYFIEKKNFHHNANSMLFCSCSVCIGQNRMSVPYLDKIFEDRKIKADRAYFGQEQSFKWMIECLLPTGPIEGCQIQMPDTVFFEEGKPKFIVRMDVAKQKFLSVQKHPAKLKLGEIKKEFQKVVWKLKKEGETDPKVQSSAGTKRAKSINRGMDYVTANIAAQNTAQCLGKETAILRCEVDGEEQVSVLLEKNFSDFMMRRQSDPKWLQVLSIQTCIKSHKGIGKPTYINFFAPINLQDREAEVQYDFKCFDSDKKLQAKHDPRDFCLKQCYKMCFFISKAHGWQILKMKALFLKDDNGKIWFSHCSRIQARQRRKRDLENEFVYKKVNLLNQENKKKLMKELDEHQEVQAEVTVDPRSRITKTQRKYSQSCLLITRISRASWASSLRKIKTTTIACLTKCTSDSDMEEPSDSAISSISLTPHSKALLLTKDRTRVEDQYQGRTHQ